MPSEERGNDCAANRDSNSDCTSTACHFSCLVDSLPMLLVWVQTGCLVFSIAVYIQNLLTLLQSAAPFEASFLRRCD